MATLSQVHLLFAGRLTHVVLRGLDWLSARLLKAPELPAHQLVGKRGEEAAYFYLRRRGYTMISRNYRSPHSKGELDLVGWEGDVLCFIEVKTRTTRAVRPAEAAVDRDKQRDLGRVAQEFLRHMSPSCQWRFDILTVYYDYQASQPMFELFQNAFSVS